MSYFGIRHTLVERLELIVREEINKSSDLENFTDLLVKRLLELIQDEIKFGRQN